MTDRRFQYQLNACDGLLAEIDMEVERLAVVIPGADSLAADLARFDLARLLRDRRVIEELADVFEIMAEAAR